MDFTPVGSSFGTDEILSNSYLDSSSTYDAMLTHAEIHQRKYSPYAEEISRLQRAKASKLAAAKSNSSSPSGPPGGPPGKPPESFVTVKGKRESSEPFHMNPRNPWYGRPQATLNDDLIMCFILIVILVVLVSMVRAADRKSTRLNSSHSQQSRMPSSA